MTGNDAFVDTSVFLAAMRKQDADYERGKELLVGMDRDRTRARITDHILSETVTFILKKDGHERAAEILKKLEAHTTVHFVDREGLDEAKNLLRKYWGPKKRLSICDATTWAMMQRTGVKELYSFDRGFDGLPDLRRIA